MEASKNLIKFAHKIPLAARGNKLRVFDSVSRVIQITYLEIKSRNIPSKDYDDEFNFKKIEKFMFSFAV
jgi:hypothetical protein